MEGRRKEKVVFFDAGRNPACNYAIFLYSAAHVRHVCAYLLQWSTSCRSHSFAHASQTATHRLQNCFANWPSIDISDADVQQTAAHSLFIWAQLDIIASDSQRSEVAQNSHASAQRMHACTHQYSFAISCFEGWQLPCVLAANIALMGTLIFSWTILSVKSGDYGLTRLAIILSAGIFCSTPVAIAARFLISKDISFIEANMLPTVNTAL